MSLLGRPDLPFGQRFNLTYSVSLSVIIDTLSLVRSERQKRQPLSACAQMLLLVGLAAQAFQHCGSSYNRRFSLAPLLPRSSPACTGRGWACRRRSPFLPFWPST